MVNRLLLMLLTSVVAINGAHADTCDAYFPDVVQGHAANSTIGFTNQGRIIDPINTELAFDSLEDNSNNGNEICSVNGSQVACTISGEAAPSFNLPDFQTTTEGNNLTYPDNNSYNQTVEVTTSNIQALTVQDGANLTFNSNNSPFKINSANFLEQSEITLQTGIYWFNELTISANAKVYIEGPVTIYVNGELVIENQGQLNYENGNGIAKDLAIVNWSSVSLSENAKVSATLYGNIVEMTDQAQLTGAISVEDKLTIFNNAKVYYQDVSDVIIGSGCNSTPVAEYRFDETQYSDVANEVIDSIGSFHGQATSAQPVEGKVCNAIDLSASGTADYATLDNDILNNKTDFSISVWVKTPKTSTQSILSGATSGSFNELIMWFTSDSTFQPHLQNRHNGSLNITSIAGDTWHHLVWSRSGTQSCLYIDGVLQGCLTQSAEILEIDSLILGQEQDSVGGAFVSSQAFEGLIDELLVFDSAISADQIEAIYDNQNAGLGYDGSARTCPVTPLLAPLLEYRFEEQSWNGTVDEIIDYSGNNHHGRVNNNSEPETSSPALPGNIGTCGYASQNDGAIEVTDLPLDTDTAGVKTSVTFWMYWDGTNNVMPIGWNIHDIWIVNGSMGFNTGQSDIYGISSDGLANGWHHVAVEFTNGSVTSNKIHIDGVNQQLTQRLNNPYTPRAYVDSELRIGGWSYNSSYDFHGRMDEVRVYEGALSTEQINTIMNETHACETEVIDHYEIIHDGSGLTCNAESVTIKACTDSACSSLSSESVSLDLQATSASSGLETKSAVSFDSGSATISFNHFYAETISLSIANENISATNEVVCSGSTGTSCDISFSDSGFIFEVPTQTACAISDEITISAVQKDATSLQCVPSFSSVDKTLNFWNSYNNPATGNHPITLTQNAIEYSLPSSEGSAVPISFDANGQAILQVTYPDAGQITLNASYDGTASNSDLGLRMTGSDLFVSVPAKLVVASTDSNADCASNDASCSAFKAAGEDFNLSVGATCADGTITPNFQMDDISLSVNDIAPDISNPVSLAITSVDISDSDNGIHSESTQTISEVGVFSITATPNNLYFTETIAAATSTSIGRFTPSYYQLGGIDNGVLSGGNPFVYTGQMETTSSTIGQISYLTQPEFTITAKSVSGNTTLNYTGDFIKLLETGIDRETPIQDADQFGKDTTNKVDLSATLNLALFEEYTAGVLKYQFNSSDHYVYTRNANSLIAPFTSAIDLQINSIIDSDNITAADLDSDTTNGVLTLQPQGVEIRFGRWIMENSYGPEISDIRIPMSTQYWNASYFVTNDEDSFTSFNATDASITDNQLSPAATPSIVGSGLFTSGETSELTVESPGADVRGSITIEQNVPSWLKYDWSVVDESYDENPSAIATFGLYRGNDRIIYRQEVFN